MKGIGGGSSINTAENLVHYEPIWLGRNFTLYICSQAFFSLQLTNRSGSWSQVVPQALLFSLASGVSLAAHFLIPSSDFPLPAQSWGRVYPSWYLTSVPDPFLASFLCTALRMKTEAQMQSIVITMTTRHQPRLSWEEINGPDALP